MARAANEVMRTEAIVASIKLACPLPVLESHFSNVTKLANPPIELVPYLSKGDRVNPVSISFGEMLPDEVSALYQAPGQGTRSSPRWFVAGAGAVV
jgi:hypothetical protein